MDPRTYYIIYTIDIKAFSTDQITGFICEMENEKEKYKFLSCIYIKQDV